MGHCIKPTDGAAARNVPAVPARVSVENGCVIIDAEQTAAIMNALGTADTAFLEGMTQQIVNAATRGKEPDVQAINYMLATISGIGPQDQIEAMLAAQMSAIHNAAMTFARVLAHAETIVQRDSAERTFNKLTRTFIAQIEGLKRYRTGGQQKMVVEHVTVNEGGQAIVGNVQGGGGVSKKAGTTP